MTAMKEVLDSSGKDATSETYHTFNKSTFPVYFRTLFVALVDCMKQIPAEVNPASVADILKSWATALKLLNHLVSAGKSMAKRTFLITCLKYGRSCVELFHKQAMPLLDKQFKNFLVDCQNLLKNLQTSTRILQHFCTHAKVSQDAVLGVYVPAAKKTLESLIYRVKAMLAANGCVSAFWLGNLKNKNLQGEEIISQRFSESEESDQEPVAESDTEDDNVTVALAANDSDNEGRSVSPDY